MLWLENLRIALYAIWAHKLRSILTVTGIVIGVAVTVGVQGILQGITGIAIDAIQGLGSGTLFVVPYRPPGKEGEKLGRVELTVDDGESVKRLCSEVIDLAPFIERPAGIKKGDEKGSATVLGTTPNFQDVRSFFVERGRMFSHVEEEHRSRVCAIGVDVIDTLHLKGDPLGQYIKIGNQEFQVIGIMEKKGRIFGENFDERILIPISTAAAIWGEESIKQVFLYIRGRAVETNEIAMDQVTDVLRRRHRLRSGQPNDFQVFSQVELMKTFRKITDGISIGAAVIVGFALLVASIGVTNIMLVSVTERTREIGIRKAIGARSGHILVQFLVESVTLCCLGGAIGIFAGLGFSLLGQGILNHLVPGWPAISIPVLVYILGVTVPAIFGVLAGLWPAYKAAHLDPIESLRYE